MKQLFPKILKPLLLICILTVLLCRVVSAAEAGAPAPLNGFNFVLFGLDGESWEDGGRSDTIMICSIDSDNQAIRLISILRDSKVDIPGYPSQKINAAYKFGGAELALETIRINYHLDLHQYITVDFDTLRRIIDTLDGIEMELTEEEAGFINEFCEGYVQAGTNTLNGDQALVYARIRSIDSDIDRTGRQQNVISRIFARLRQASILQWLELIYEIIVYVDLSLDLSDILKVLDLDLPDYTITHYVVPDEAYETDLDSIIDENGQWVWTYNPADAGERIVHIINND